MQERLSYTPQTGVFVWLVVAHNVRTVKAGERAGFITVDGYREIYIEGRSRKEHRLAWLYVHGEWPRGVIDHINGNKTDNRIVNLRDVSRRVNQQNLKRAQSHNKCGLLGVSGSRGRFSAAINVCGNRRHLGTFATAEEAHEAYLSVKRASHEGCTI